MPIQIAADPTVTIGMKHNGTVIGTSVMDGISRLNEWQDIVSIDAGISHTVGLKSDGTLLFLGCNSQMMGVVTLGTIYCSDPKNRYVARYPDLLAEYNPKKAST